MYTEKSWGGQMTRLGIFLPLRTTVPLPAKAFSFGAEPSAADPPVENDGRRRRGRNVNTTSVRTRNRGRARTSYI